MVPRGVRVSCSPVKDIGCPRHMRRDPWVTVLSVMGARACVPVDGCPRPWRPGQSGPRCWFQVVHPLLWLSWAWVALPSLEGPVPGQAGPAALRRPAEAAGESAHRHVGAPRRLLGQVVRTLGPRWGLRERWHVPAGHAALRGFHGRGGSRCSWGPPRWGVSGNWAVMGSWGISNVYACRGPRSFQV